MPPFLLWRGMRSVTILRRIAYSRIAGLWSLPHLSGEASGQSPISPQSPHGAGRTANTPQGRVRTFCLHVFAVSGRQRFWCCLFGFSAGTHPPSEGAPNPQRADVSQTRRPRRFTHAKHHSPTRSPTARSLLFVRPECQLCPLGPATTTDHHDDDPN